MKRGTFGGGVGPRSDRVGPDLEALRERFWNYTPKDADHERRGILFWDTDPELNCAGELHIEEHPDRGFVVIWVVLIPKGMKPTSLWSVGDASLLSDEDWFNIADDAWALKGNFIPLPTAWNAIEDFFQDPMSPSKRVRWIDSDDMPPHPVR